MGPGPTLHIRVWAYLCPSVFICVYLHSESRVCVNLCPQSLIWLAFAPILVKLISQSTPKFSVFFSEVLFQLDRTWDIVSGVEVRPMDVDAAASWDNKDKCGYSSISWSLQIIAPLSLSSLQAELLGNTQEQVWEGFLCHLSQLSITSSTLFTMILQNPYPPFINSWSLLGMLQGRMKLKILFSFIFILHLSPSIHLLLQLCALSIGLPDRNFPVR